MLARLGIRQKLGLLLTIPLVAVALAMVPLAAERVDAARSAGVTARTALAAREVGTLLQTLQVERVLALGYLSTPSLEHSALLTQSELAIDGAARLQHDPLTAAVLAGAARPLAALSKLRERVLSRTVDPIAAYGVYRDVDEALINGLSLGTPTGADPSGLSRLAALDSLMRSSEEASGASAVLVAAVANKDVSRAILAETMTADQQHLRRFRELANRDQSTLVDTIEFEQSGQRIRALVTAVTQPAGGAGPQLSEALSAAISYTGLRHLAQDRVAREIALDAESRAAGSRATALGVAGGAAMVFFVVVGLGVTVSRSISRPLRRLTQAAAVVADLARAELVRVADSDSPEPAPPQLAAIEVESLDEIGELATVMNRVQATAALLLERQVVARRNVSVMFANIARRTQNLVGRQLALIDDLERNERNPELLARLYRLDHVATRLRRSADSLFVVSGTIDQVMSGAPTPLIDVIRSAMSEIEGFRAVRLGVICDVALSAGLVTDLRLLLSELLENATNFSPPGSPVEVSAVLDEGCRLTITDHGLGLGPARLEEENNRLVERERLDVAPTTVLGLFVVGRLARRHGLTVHLEHSRGRGVTACVEIPTTHLSDASALVKPLASAGPLRLPAAFAAEAATIQATHERTAKPFAWFAAAVAVAVPPRPALDPVPVSRVAPAQVPAPVPALEQPAPPYLPEPQRALAPQPTGGYAGSMTAEHPVIPLPRRAVAAPTEMPTSGDGRSIADGRTTGSGLTRRVPGTNLDDEVRGAPPEEPPTVRVVRDPEAERGILNEYLAGLARGADDTEHAAHPSQPSLPERQS